MALNWLKENITKARENLAVEVAKFKNRDFMEAVVSGCALVAAADGTVDASEKQKMAAFLERSDELKHFDIRQVIEVFNKAVGDFEFDHEIGKANALQTVGKVRGKEDQARVIVRVVCAIGAADGDFDDNEKAMVRDITRELGLKPEEFDL
ncbi:tellurite resistance TerB family protein [Halomonas sp. CSM-2]|uniref:tellurite resistance TerB family protein n=1 Tax=Halomonas sp. CSM-2 TaxID=1975722 RepID=UPI000A282333|nr:tellurite resistance TerB family protein [Halomonas sp. CSM-2]